MKKVVRRGTNRRQADTNYGKLTYNQQQTLRNALHKLVKNGVNSIGIVADWLRAAAAQVKMIKSVVVEKGKILLGIREGNSQKTVRLSLNDVKAFCN